MESRLCVPTRCEGITLGFLWILDPDESLTGVEVDQASSAAQMAGSVLFRQRLIDELTRSREREALRDLLSENPSVRQHAADELVEGELFRSEGPVAVLVSKLVPASTAEAGLPDEARTTLDHALQRASQMIPAKRSLGLVRPDHCMFMVSVGDPGGQSAAQLALELFEILRAHSESGRWRILIGVGDTQPSLLDARVSYLHAASAARLAEAFSSLAPIAVWADLGIYRLFAKLDPEETFSDLIPPAVTSLLGSRNGQALLRTLECYLGNAGEVKATAEQLFLHRTSLYYRLQQVERIGGVDLGNGDDRLALHLGLKMARLNGLLV